MLTLIAKPRFQSPGHWRQPLNPSPRIHTPSTHNRINLPADNQTPIIAMTTRPKKARGTPAKDTTPLIINLESLRQGFWSLCDLTVPDLLTWNDQYLAWIQPDFPLSKNN
jgi:hypothetical protein